MASRRIPLWDNVKCFLILAVVLGHFVDGFHRDSHLYQSIFVFCYSFHMPVFLFIAGMFHKNTRIAQKVVSFLSIYLLYKGVLLLEGQFFGTADSFNLFGDSAAPWYTFCMAVFILLTFLLQSVEPRFLLGVGILAACLAGYDASIGDGFYLSRTLVLFPCYLAGTMVSKERLERLTQNRRLRLAALFVLLGWAAVTYLGIERVYILRHLFTGRNPYRESIWIYGGAFRLLCYLISAVIGLALILVVPSRDLGFVTRFGQRTLQIYFWHVPVLNLLKGLNVPELIRIQHIPGKLLWLGIAVALTLLLSLPVFRYPTDFLMSASRRKE